MAMASIVKNSVVLAIITSLSIFLSACGWGSDSHYVKSVERTPSGFFRVFADIRVKETGEIVKLDYVVACGGTVTNWTYTTPSVSYGMVPQIMLVPTSSGELIGARTPKGCQHVGAKTHPSERQTGNRDRARARRLPALVDVVSECGRYRFCHRLPVRQGL
jgi:hypothetical protein